MMYRQLDTPTSELTLSDEELVYNTALDPRAKKLWNNDLDFVSHEGYSDAVNALLKAIAIRSRNREQTEPVLLRSALVQRDRLPQGEYLDGRADALFRAIAYDTDESDEQTTEVDDDSDNHLR
jgi:hypothetical protein